MKTELQTFLASDCLRVFYTKGKNEKSMVCTLDRGMIPAGQRDKKHHDRGDMLTVWDLERLCWRTFDTDAVVGMERVVAAMAA